MACKPELPQYGEYLWLMYIDVQKGCEKVTYTELDAYQRVKGENFTHWEADLMVELDSMRRTSG